jgi:hypothetical protein
MSQVLQQLRIARTKQLRQQQGVRVSIVNKALNYALARLSFDV